MQLCGRVSDLLGNPWVAGQRVSERRHERIMGPLRAAKQRTDDRSSQKGRQWQTVDVIDLRFGWALGEDFMQGENPLVWHQQLVGLNVVRASCGHAATVPAVDSLNILRGDQYEKTWSVPGSRVVLTRCIEHQPRRVFDP